MLTIRDISVKIGQVEAIRNFSMDVAPGSMIGLVGRNGAGKTTVMRAIMGLARLGNGSISFDGQNLEKIEVHRRPSLGLGYMPETRGLIPDLTVEENILLPTWVRPGVDSKAKLKLVYDIMPELVPMAGRKALLLSGGQQKLVALGRALTVGTRLLLLDEPFEGVAPALAQRLSEVISALRSESLSTIMSMSEITHSETLLDQIWRIERGANVSDIHA